MNEVTKEQIISALQALGVQQGDGLLVHSAIQFLGRPVGGIGIYLEALQAQISPGTIAVPTFNFSFARGEPYDPQFSPSIGMGAFSEYVRQQPDALRTPHPMQSLAVIGKYADDLAGRDTPSAFDPGSAFERMLELGFKILLLGADIDAISMIHYSEQRLQVPYRYWKEFTGFVRSVQGNAEQSDALCSPLRCSVPSTVQRLPSTVHRLPLTAYRQCTYRMYVRDMDLDPKLTLHRVRDYLRNNGQYYSVPLNYGQVDLIHMSDFVVAVDQFLMQDPYSLMINYERSLSTG